MTEFLAMGGYGYYVWSAYGVTALALALEIVALRLRRKAALAQARDTEHDAADPATGAVG